MKKKITIKLLSVILVFVLIFSFSNIGSALAQTEPINDNELYNIENTENAENTQSTESRSANSSITSGAVYSIKNAASGKYVNVHNGIDATGTNVYQWTADGSAEQKFKVVYSSSDDAYKFYCMCSSNGTNRVLDIKRDDAAVASGQNVQICGPVDATAQNWTIVSLGSNKYKICVKANTSLALTSYGNSNGTSTGTSSTSAGNVFISTYTGAQNQMWYFEKEGSSSTVKPTGWLDSVSTSKISGWAWRSDIPDTPIDVHIYVKNTSSGNQWVYPVTASTYRADLKNAGYGNGNHGFSSPINWLTFPAGTYQIDAYGIGANNPPLSGSPKTYTVRNMTGNIEYLNENGIGGWAWKPDAPDAAVSIHIYVYKSDGTRVGFYVASAAQPRPDLQNLGYGNGRHGFSYAIPWDTLPEENLRVVAYMVDNSGYHPSLCNRYYDNRKVISLIGMTDNDGIDFSGWMTSAVIEYCNNIGCTEVNKYIGANGGGLIELIRASSYCVISTHGSSNSISWCLHPNDPNNIQRGYLTTYDLNQLSDDYFDTTRCVLIDACLTGYGGTTNSSNFANTLQSKGIESVVGFEGSITAFFDPLTKDAVDDKGCELWAKVFTKSLGQGYTVSSATMLALDEVKNADAELYEEYFGFGLEEVYIAGNPNQIVKH